MSSSPFGSDNTRLYGYPSTPSRSFGVSNTYDFGSLSGKALSRHNHNQSQMGISTNILAEPFDELSSSLARLFTTGSYSDLTIICGDDRYQVHKAIVCYRSAFFEAACNSPFKEAISGEIDLADDDPLIVKMMIHYFYHLDYNFTAIVPPEDKLVNPTDQFDSEANHRRLTGFGLGSFPAPKGSKPPSNLSLHAKVYALGEKYGIKGLKALALKKFELEAKDQWNTDDFLVAVQEVYSSTMEHDRSMRDVVVATFNEHLGLLDKASVQEVIKDLHLAFDLLMDFRKRRGAFQ